MESLKKQDLYRPCFRNKAQILPDSGSSGCFANRLCNCTPSYYNFAHRDLNKQMCDVPEEEGADCSSTFRNYSRAEPHTLLLRELRLIIRLLTLLILIPFSCRNLRFHVLNDFGDTFVQKYFCSMPFSGRGIKFFFLRILLIKKENHYVRKKIS